MKKTISLILCAVIVVTAAVVVTVKYTGKLNKNSVLADATVMKYNDIEIYDSCSVEFPNGYRGVIENEKFALGYKVSDASVALLNKNTGYVWYTNPIESGGSTKAKSQLEFYYYNSNSVVNMNSYEYAIEAGLVPRYELDGNSITVNYELGDTAFELAMMPAVVKKERFENEFLSKLTEEEKAEVLSNYTLFDRESLNKETYDIMIISYPSLRDSDLYVRPSDIPNYVAEKSYNLLVKAGYTMEDLQKDCDDNGIENTYVEKPYFKAQLKYYLTDDGFAVSLDPKTIEYNKNYIPVKVDILPYFGAADQKEKGFILLPDGSGAVAKFNNGKITENVYNKSFFETDAVFNETTAKPESQLSLLPYFGMSNKKGGFIASVDSGYEVGGVTAQISGMNGNFNAVSSYFNLFINSKVNYSSSANDTFYRFAENIYSDIINISYHFTDSTPEYSDLALVYRDYLKKNGVLSESAIENNGMNITFKGVAEATKNILGFNYKSYEAYTTVDEATEILEKLNLENVDVRLDNFTVGGEIQNSISSLKLESSVGNIKDIKSVQKLSRNVFLSFHAQHISKDSKDYAAIAISQEPAYGLEFNTASLKKELWRYSVVVSPKYLLSASQKLVNQIKKNEIKAINVEDIGYSFSSDLREYNEIGRYESRKAVQKYLSDISDSAILSVNKGSIYSLKYADKIWDIPMSSSNYSLEDYSVPFYQLVISGSIPYTTPIINDSSEIHSQFLKSLEYGAQPHFCLCYRKLDSVDYYKDDFYSFLYEDYIDTIKDYSVKINEVSEKINGASMISHKSENGISLTEYDNGVKIYINYNDKDKKLGNGIVESHNYLIVG